MKKPDRSFGANKSTYIYTKVFGSIRNANTRYLNITLRKKMKMKDMSFFKKTKHGVGFHHLIVSQRLCENWGLRLSLDLLYYVQDTLLKHVGQLLSKQ